MHRRPDNVARQKEFGKGNEMEDHAQIGGMQGDAAEQVAGAA